MTTVFEALSAVMADVGHVAKGQKNTQQGYSFRGIDDVLRAVGPAFRAHKIIVAPKVIDYQHGTVEVGQKRTLVGHVRVTVAYTFFGPDGDSIESSAPGEAMDAGDKATPKAMSVAFRTALLQVLALPTDEPDPDSQTYERSASAPDPTVAAKKRLWEAHVQAHPTMPAEERTSHLQQLCEGVDLTDGWSVDALVRDIEGAA